MLRDLISALIGLWIVIGVYIDGWAHVNLTGAVETFFTPWHATFYSGLAAFAIWVGLIRWRLGHLPPGYTGAVAGIAIFAAGGAFDMFWHTVLGIEVSIDALLSPPHLVLLTGALLMMTTGWRAQRATSPKATITELISLASVVAVCAFFLNFLAPFRWAAPMQRYVEHGNEEIVIRWIAGLLVFTALLLIPLLWQVRDGRYRVGTLTALVLASGLGVVLAMSQGWDKNLLLTGVAGTAIGAMIGEILLARLAWRTWRYGLPLMMGVVALLLWTAQFTAYALTATVQWPVTLWAGSLLFAAGAGAALGATVWSPIRQPSPAAPPAPPAPPVIL